MKWLGLIIAIIISSRLSKSLYNGTKRAETDGMACCIWMRIAFCLIYSVSACALVYKLAPKTFLICQ